MNNIYLIGMMGCGKTSVGKLLADLLCMPFFDLDEAISADAGMTISDIFQTEGEASFRARESEVLAKIASLEGATIACGGGTPLSENNVATMRRTGVIIYVDRPVSHIMRDVDFDTRPLIRNGGEHALVKLHVERDAIYRAVSDVVFKNDYADARSAAVALSKRTRGAK